MTILDQLAGHARARVAAYKEENSLDVLQARCRALGLLYEMKHIVSSYQKGYGDRQLTFFTD